MASTQTLTITLPASLAEQMQESNRDLDEIYFGIADQGFSENAARFVDAI
jgi:hypothetical protein